MRCNTDESRDYQVGVEEGIRILKLYGYEIHLATTKANTAKEEIKLKLALGKRSYSCLTSLPMAEVPIQAVFSHTTRYCLFSNQDKLMKIIAYNAIRCALKNGIDKDFPKILSLLGGSLTKQGQVKAANELGYVSLQLAEKIRDDLEHYATCRMAVYVSIINLQSFSSLLDPFLQCHKDLKLVGVVETSMGAMLAYFQSYFAAGLELGPVLESKVAVLEEYSRDVDRPSFLLSFQVYRQFALNLRTRTDKPTEFAGEAFQEEDALSKLTGNAHKMALRDSSSHRIQLAFVFRDEDTMSQMLTTLKDYPLADQLLARLHNRLAFTGLAAMGSGPS